MAATDTTARAREIQTKIHRSQDAATKFWAAVEMSDFVHQLAAAGLRQRVPNVADADIPRLLAETIYARGKRP
jgi:hypothetical protein